MCTMCGTLIRSVGGYSATVDDNARGEGRFDRLSPWPSEDRKHEFHQRRHVATHRWRPDTCHLTAAGQQFCGDSYHAIYGWTQDRTLSNTMKPCQNFLPATMPSTNPQTALLIFCSYAAEDEVHRRAFEKSLASVKRAGLVDIWSNQQIKAGDNIELAIESALRSAHVIVLLISNSFIASDTCWDNEMTFALKKHMNHEVRIIPILVSSCLWENTPLASLKPLPSNAKPVTSWNIQDDAWASIAGDINEVIKAIQIEELKRNTPISIREIPTEQDKVIIKRILEKLEKFSSSLPSIEFSIDDLLQLGDARFVSGDIDEAIRLYHRAIHISPENASSWQKLGFALEVGHGRYEEALKYYNVSLALDPAQTETHIDRSYVLRQLGQFPASIDAATSALFLDIGNARALYNRACSYARFGNKLEALMNLNAAINLNPDRYRAMAAWDKDFQTLGAMPEFIRLIGNKSNQ